MSSRDAGETSFKSLGWTSSSQEGEHPCELSQVRAAQWAQDSL